MITGDTGSIGEAAAKLFLKEGAKVMRVGRSAEELEATRDRLASERSLFHCAAPMKMDGGGMDAIY
ncbi:MAG: SDR family NAD(P)-dependent oxidoreductase [Acidobacteriia bacterium]|nr:SDR family NAD(P)-dependent oxidoreductase [Terriglobia bacterium]